MQNIPLLLLKNKGMAVPMTVLGCSTQDKSCVVQRSSSTLALMLQSLVG